MRFFLFAALVLFLTAYSNFAQTKEGGNKPLAPSLNVVSLDGKIFDSKDLKGKIVVLNLWFINCPNCVAEIKMLNKVVDDYHDKDVVFIGLATNKKADLEKFLKKNPFKYNVVPSAMQTILSFGEPNQKGEINIPFPMHIFINREGKIEFRVSGTKGVKAVEEELARQLKSEKVKAK